MALVDALSQSLMLALTPSELCRALFGFHRARCSDPELLAAVSEVLVSEAELEEEGVQKLGVAQMSANDVAMLFKAFSKHGYAPHQASVDALLSQTRQTLPDAALTDISQLLAAIVRLELGGRLGGGGGEAPSGPHSGLLNQLFQQARSGLLDRLAPVADVTNLCVAAARLPPCEQGAVLLADVAEHLTSKPHAAGLSPRDLLRRAQSILTFDERLGDSGIQPVQQRHDFRSVFHHCSISIHSRS